MTNTEQILSSPSSCFNLFLTMALLAEQSQETVMISWTNSILQKHEQKNPGQNEQPMTGSMQEETKKKMVLFINGEIQLLEFPDKVSSARNQLFQNIPGNP